MLFQLCHPLLNADVADDLSLSRLSACSMKPENRPFISSGDTSSRLSIFSPLWAPDMYDCRALMSGFAAKAR